MEISESLVRELKSALGQIDGQAKQYVVEASSAYIKALELKKKISGLRDKMLVAFPDASPDPDPTPDPEPDPQPPEIEPLMVSYAELPAACVGDHPRVVLEAGDYPWKRLVVRGQNRVVDLSRARFHKPGETFTNANDFVVINSQQLFAKETKLVGAITPETISLAGDLNNLPAPGERVTLMCGLRPDDPAEYMTQIHVKVESVNHSTGAITFTEPLGINVPFWDSADELRAVVNPTHYYKIGQWGTTFQGNFAKGNINGVGEHGLRRYVGGRTNNVRVIMPEIVDYDGTFKPAGGWLATFRDCDKCVVEGATSNNWPFIPFHFWYAEDCVAIASRLKGEAHGHPIVSCWGGRRNLVADCRVDGTNWGIFNNEIGVEGFLIESLRMTAHYTRGGELIKPWAASDATIRDALLRLTAEPGVKPALQAVLGQQPILDNFTFILDGEEKHPPINIQWDVQRKESKIYYLRDGEEPENVFPGDRPEIGDISVAPNLDQCVAWYNFDDSSADNADEHFVNDVYSRSIDFIVSSVKADRPTAHDDKLGRFVLSCNKSGQTGGQRIGANKEYDAIMFDSQGVISAEFTALVAIKRTAITRSFPLSRGTTSGSYIIAAHPGHVILEVVKKTTLQLNRKIRLNEWALLALTVNGAETCLYVFDGDYVGVKKATIPVAEWPVAASQTVFGARGPTSEPVRGYVALGAIFRRCLTATDLAWVYNGGNVRRNLVE